MGMIRNGAVYVLVLFDNPIDLTTTGYPRVRSFALCERCKYLRFVRAAILIASKWLCIYRVLQYKGSIIAGFLLFVTRTFLGFLHY